MFDTWQSYAAYLFIVAFLCSVSFNIFIVYNLKKLIKNKEELKKQIEEEKQKTALALSQKETETITLKKGDIFPYILTDTVFTKQERLFYDSLKPVADKLELVVFTKMRIIDLVYIPKNQYDRDRWFNYVKAKHVDFVLCDKDMKPKLLIEVDGETHTTPEGIKRDEFVNKIFNQLGIYVLHIYKWSDDNLQDKIVEALTKELVVVHQKPMLRSVYAQAIDEDVPF